MQMLTVLAIVAIVAAVGMAGTVMSFPQVAHAAKGGVPGPDPNSGNVCVKNTDHPPGKCI